MMIYSLHVFVFNVIVEIETTHFGASDRFCMRTLAHKCMRVCMYIPYDFGTWICIVSNLAYSG